MNIIIFSLSIFLVVLFTNSHVAANNELEEFFSFVEQQQQKNWEIEEKKVMAFYYPWYRSKDYSGRWVHWEKVDEENQEISNSTNYPQLGAYDSLDEEVVTTHFKQASEVGIDTFIVSWWGPSTLSDNAVDLILDKAEEYDISITLYYEKNPGNSEEERIKKTTSDLSYIAREYTEHSAYLKVKDKPVLFIYGRVMNEVPIYEWKKIFEKMKENNKIDYNFIADIIDEKIVEEPQKALVPSMFDGIHVYNIASFLESLSLKQIEEVVENGFGQLVNAAEIYDKISTVTIIPGYDDTKIRAPGLKIPRRNEKLYSTLWEKAIDANPDWILITSWNEWHEGSEIEPSIEYDDKYLEITEKYSKQFKEQTTDTKKKD